MRSLAHGALERWILIDRDNRAIIVLMSEHLESSLATPAHWDLNT